MWNNKVIEFNGKDNPLMFKTSNFKNVNDQKYQKLILMELLLLLVMILQHRYLKVN